MKRLNSKLAAIIFAAIVSLLTILLLVIDIIVQKNNGAEQTIVIVLAISLVVSLLSYGAYVVLIYRTRLHSVNALVNSMNSIEYTQEEVFNVGIMTYNDQQVISFVTPWMQEEGFDKFLGKDISKLGLDVETLKPQSMEFASRKWEVVASRKNKTFLFKDVSLEDTLKGIISDQQNIVLSFHTSFSKKVNFNDYVKSETSLKINQAIQDWTNKMGGIFNSSISSENTSMSIVKWETAQKDIESEALLNSIKQSLGKSSKDTTISIGIAFGNTPLIELFDKSLRSLEIAKNRGGDQIVLEKPDGEISYVGTSSIQANSSSVMSIKKFYSQFTDDLSKAREVYITSHKFADLDAVGGSLGIYEIMQRLNIDTKIVMDTFDSTTEKYIKTLPKALRDAFITEAQALKKMSNRAHIVITDTSSPVGTQAAKLIEAVSIDKISVIDHHRLGQDNFEFQEEKILIETAISSVSEIVVEMLKLSTSQDVYGEITPVIATGLLAGIKLDSKQLTKNVTNATFDAVSFLMSNEADALLVEELFRPSQKLIKVESEALKNITKPVKGVVFTFVSETTPLNDEDTSILADKLLTYDGVEASFVLAKTNNNRFKLSIRSNDKINVQLIAESLGGGGHFNAAAASWPTNIKYNTVKKRVLNAINKGAK